MTIDGQHFFNVIPVLSHSRTAEQNIRINEQVFTVHQLLSVPTVRGIEGVEISCLKDNNFSLCSLELFCPFLASVSGDSFISLIGITVI